MRSALKLLEEKYVSEVQGMPGGSSGEDVPDEIVIGIGTMVYDRMKNMTISQLVDEFEGLTINLIQAAEGDQSKASNLFIKVGIIVKYLAEKENNTELLENLEMLARLKLAAPPKTRIGLNEVEQVQ